MELLYDYITERIRIDNIKRNTEFDFDNGPIDLGDIEGVVQAGRNIKLNADDWQTAVIRRNSDHDMDLLVFWSEKCNLVVYAIRHGIEHGHKLHVIEANVGSVDYDFYTKVLKDGTEYIELNIPYVSKSFVSIMRFPKIFETVIDRWMETWK